MESGTFTTSSDRSKPGDPTQELAPSASQGNSQGTGAGAMALQGNDPSSRGVTVQVTPPPPSGTTSSAVGPTRTQDSDGSDYFPTTGPSIYRMEPRTHEETIGNYLSDASPSFLEWIVWEELGIDQRYLWHFGLDRSHYATYMTVEMLRFIANHDATVVKGIMGCLLYTSPSPRDLSTSRMPSSA